MRDNEQYISPDEKIQVEVFVPVNHIYWWLFGHICEWLYDTYDQDELDSIPNEAVFVCLCKRSNSTWQGWFDDGYGLYSYAALAKIFELDDLEQFSACELNQESLITVEVRIVDSVVHHIWEDIEDEPRLEKLKELIGLAYENIYPECRDIQKEYMKLR